MTSRSSGMPVAGGDLRPDATASAAGLAVGGVVVEDLGWLHTTVAVDVLLVVAGFLTARSALAAAVDGSWSAQVSLCRHARRVLPPLITVLVITGAVVAVAMPPTWWPGTQATMLATALLVPNWYLALVAPGTAPDGPVPGVLAHLWVVGVLAQLVVLAVMVTSLGVGVARRARSGVHGPVALLFLAVAVVSALYAGLRVDGDPTLVHLDTGTRAWEFAAGALVATVGGRGRPSRLAASCFVVVGLAGLALAVSLPAPGSVGVTVLAVLGACAVVHTLPSARRRTPGALDAVALAVLLWHGPVLVVYLALRARPEVGPWGGAVVLAVTLALTAGTHLVSWRRPTPWSAPTRGAWCAVAAVGVLLVVTSAWYGVTTTRPGLVADIPDPAHPGAAARLLGYREPELPASPVSVVPTPATRGGDWAQGGNMCRSSRFDPELDVCSTPRTAPRFRVAVVGDSHAEQLMGAILPVVEERQGQLVTMLRGACPLSTVSETVPGDAGCASWNRAVVQELDALRPDLVVTLASHDVRVGPTERTPPGFVAAWRELERAGIPVLAVRDNPRMPFSPPACVDDHPAEPGVCATPRDLLLSRIPPWAGVGPLPRNVTFLDLSDVYCTDTVCPAVVGNVLVYLDTNHPSAAFLRTAAPVVGPAVLGAIAGGRTG